MIYVFKPSTIHPTVGKAIKASKECRRSIHPRGLKSLMHYKLYDINGNLIGEYSNSVRGWAKSIAKEMYRSKRGSLESFYCLYPH